MVNKWAVVAVIAVVILGGALVLAQDKDDSNDVKPHEITIQDSLGKDVTLTVPVMKVCTVNTNAAEFMKILGISERVVSADNGTIDMLSSVYSNVTDVGGYSNPSGEMVVSSGATVVISQSSSRSLSAATEQTLKDNYGITVLRLDCYGSTMLSDVETLLKVFESSSADSAFAEYKTLYKSVIDTVLAKARSVDTSDQNTLLYFAGLNKFYNQNSELGKILDSIGGTSAIKNLVENPKGVTSAPAAEKLYEFDQTNGLDVIFIRDTGSSNDTSDASYSKLLEYLNVSVYGNPTAVTNHKVFCISTEVLSGPRDYIGYICIAESLGIDTVYDAEEQFSSFNSKYGLPLEPDYLVKTYPLA